MRLAKGLIDKFLALIALLVLFPIMLLAAVGIKISSDGPIFYKTKRMGMGMKPFTIYKFRTMCVGADKAGAITGKNDSRIFPWGDFLRKTKIDELPQLLNILFGTMAVVGPRPEDISIVEKYYTDEEKRTLDVLPGLACPGSIFNYTHGDEYLKDDDTDEAYVNNFLHIKLALDIYYLDHWSLFYDAEIIVRTVIAIVTTSVLGKKCRFPKEYVYTMSKKA